MYVGFQFDLIRRPDSFRGTIVLNDPNVTFLKDEEYLIRRGSFTLGPVLIFDIYKKKRCFLSVELIAQYGFLPIVRQEIAFTYKNSASIEYHFSTRGSHLQLNISYPFTLINYTKRQEKRLKKMDM